jgi:hypothetical protein
MVDKIKLVRGDTRPQLVLALSDDTTGNPIDVSDPATTVRMKFRELGEDVIKATLVAGKLTGRLLPDATVDYAAPYTVPGRGGRIYVDWSADALDAAGEFAGEVEVTFADGGIQTVYDLIRFTVRDQF